MSQAGLFDAPEAPQTSKKAIPGDVIHVYDLLCRIHDEITFAVNEISSQSDSTDREEMAQEMLFGIVGRLEDQGLGDPRRRNNDSGNLRKR